MHRELQKPDGSFFRFFSVASVNSVAKKVLH
jgi:hypothetical protein